MFTLIKRNECYCASDLTNWSSESNCVSKCEGDSSEYCGGPNTMYSIYETAKDSFENVATTPISSSLSNLVFQTSVNNFENNKNTISGLILNSISSYQSTDVAFQTTQIRNITNSSSSRNTNFIDLNQLLLSVNFNISLLIKALVNKTFSIDLKSPISKLPVQLLTSNLDINDCVSNCSNYGVCKLSPTNQFICVCDLNHSGSKCHLELRPCFYSPCLNYIKCDNILNDTHFNDRFQAYQNYYSDFVCTCKDQYYGKRCELKINPCENETCSGNGICKSLDNGSNQTSTIKCECFGQNSFEGEKCETKSTRKILEEASVKTSYLIAIIVLVSLYATAVLIDIHTYYFEVKSPLKQKNLSQKVPSSKPIKLQYRP